MIRKIDLLNNGFKYKVINKVTHYHNELLNITVLFNDANKEAEDINTGHIYNDVKQIKDLNLRLQTQKLAETKINKSKFNKIYIPTANKTIGDKLMFIKPDKIEKFLHAVFNYLYLTDNSSVFSVTKCWYEYIDHDSVVVINLHYVYTRNNNLLQSFNNTLQIFSFKPSSFMVGDDVHPVTVDEFIKLFT